MKTKTIFKTKRMIALIAIISLICCMLASCSKNDGSLGAIAVVSREEGSGTRGAFVEIVGVEEKDENGNKVDKTTVNAQITDSTSVMITTVSSNKSAIGYISLGSLDDTVKAVKIEGVEASAENVANGSYKVSRPFNIAYKQDLSKLGEDFIEFVLSTQGQEIIEQQGYVGVGETTNYEASAISGKLSISGSSSVSPVMEKLIEGYKKLNPNVEIELQTTDSSTGMSDAINGNCDIGMASRELKDEESAKLVSTQIALDGIAVIVNKENTFDTLTIDQVKAIYTGQTTDWSKVK